MVFSPTGPPRFGAALARTRRSFPMSSAPHGSLCRLPIAAVQARFLTLLPRVELQGRIFFRHIRCPHKKADLLQEMRSLAWKWFVRLHQRGKDATEFVATFVTLLARAVNSGRRL